MTDCQANPSVKRISLPSKTALGARKANHPAPSEQVRQPATANQGANVGDTRAQFVASKTMPHGYRQSNRRRKSLVGVIPLPTRTNLRHVQPYNRSSSLLKWCLTSERHAIAPYFQQMHNISGKKATRTTMGPSHAIKSIFVTRSQAPAKAAGQLIPTPSRPLHLDVHGHKLHHQAKEQKAKVEEYVSLFH